MPPVPLWFAGRDDLARFMDAVFARRGTGWRMDVTAANGQPAAVAFTPDAALHSLQVFGVTGRGVDRVTVFYDHPLLHRLGLRATA